MCECAYFGANISMKVGEIVTNREKYFTQANEYDTMMRILDNTSTCPLLVLTGREHGDRCVGYGYECSSCIQSWLNDDEM